MYLDYNTAYNKHMETLKDKNSVRLINGEIIKNGLKIYCVTFKTPLSPHSVDKPLKQRHWTHCMKYIPILTLTPLM